MFDGHPLPHTCEQGGRTGARGMDSSSTVLPPSVGVGEGESSVSYPHPAPLPSGAGSAPARPHRSLAHLGGSIPTSQSLGHNCQLFALSSQLTEWLPLVTQILEPCFGFPLHLVVCLAP